MKRFSRAGTTFTSVVAGAAVLAVLGTTTAVAAGMVTSKQIKNGTIKSIDVKNNSLKGVDILDGSLTGADVANGSLTGADVKDYSLTNQDIGVLYATVNSNGTLVTSSGGATTTKHGTGTYEVDFGRDVTECASVAELAHPTDGNPQAGETGTADRELNPEGIWIETRDSAGAAADRSFHLIVVC